MLGANNDKYNMRNLIQNMRKYRKHMISKVTHIYYGITELLIFQSIKLINLIRLKLGLVVLIFIFLNIVTGLALLFVSDIVKRNFLSKIFCGF